LNHQTGAKAAHEKGWETRPNGKDQILQGQSPGIQDEAIGTSMSTGEKQEKR